MNNFNWEDVPNAMTALTTLIAAIGALVITLRNSQKIADAKVTALRAAERAEEAKTAAEDAKKIMIETKDGVFELGKRVDGRLSELLAVSKAFSRAEGKIEGRAEEAGKREVPPTKVEIVARAPELEPIKVQQVEKPDSGTDPSPSSKGGE